MAQRSKFWTGTTTGDATEAPYDAPTEFSEVLRSLAGSGRIVPGDPLFGGSAISQGGVFPGELGELRVSTGGSVNVTVAAGRGLCYGGWFESTAIESFPIATPGSTRIDYITMRKDWTLQTIRLTHILGTPGSGSPPSLVQTVGDKYDTPLATVTITSGGVITVQDFRNFLPLIINPACLLSSNSNQSFAQDVALALVNWSTTLFNTHGTQMWNPGVSTSRLYIPRGGLYHIWGTIQVHTTFPFDAEYMQMKVSKHSVLGGTDTVSWFRGHDSPLNAQDVMFDFNFYEICQEGDYFYIEYAHNGTSANNFIAAATQFPGQPQSQGYPVFGARLVQQMAPWVR